MDSSSSSSSNNPDAAPASPAKSTNSTRTNTDDESITTTSTESEAYDEAWTLVTDKNRQRIKVAKEASEKSGALKASGVSASAIDTDKEEAVEADEELPEESHSNAALHEHTADDELSDGISIISESESAGRRSPHHQSDEQLSNFNLKMTLGEHYADADAALPRAKLNFPIIQSATAVAGIEDVVDRKLLTQRRRRRSSPRNVEQSNTAIEEQKALKRVDVLTQISEMPPIIRRGLSGLFYVSVAIVAVALMGKFRMLVWEPLTAQSTAQVLEQKLTDLELQNNLMRAEIDLLTKQVTYLNNMNEQRGGKPSRSFAPPPPQPPAYQEKPKTFKAWSGNGENIAPIDITKGDLKRPYKCPDGKFVEIAGMCVENTPNQKLDETVNVVDPVSNIVNNVLDKSDTLKSFVKVAEQVNAFVENPFETVAEKMAEFKADAAGQPKEMPQPPTAEQRREQWQQKRGEERYQKDFQKQYNDKENYRAGSQERKYEQQRQQKPHYRQANDNSRERFNAQRQNDSKERFTKYNAAEDKSYERHSRERKDASGGKPRYPSNNHSKERYDSKRARSVHSGERHKDGQWFGHRMQQREHVRQQRAETERNGQNWR